MAIAIQILSPCFFPKNIPIIGIISIYNVVIKLTFATEEPIRANCCKLTARKNTTAQNAAPITLELLFLI